MKRDDILEKAKELINGDRKKDYGDAWLNHKRIADYWSNYFDDKVKLTPTDVAVMMILVKIARVQNCCTDDSFIDICGYGAIAGEISEIMDWK